MKQGSLMRNNILPSAWRSCTAAIATFPTFTRLVNSSADTIHEKLVEHALHIGIPLYRPTGESN